MVGHREISGIGCRDLFAQLSQRSAMLVQNKQVLSIIADVFVVVKHLSIDLFQKGVSHVFPQNSNLVAERLTFMSKNVSWQTKVIIYCSILITGLGIGWLVGLSVSPVISIVITSITGAAAAVITALSGLEEKSKWSVSPVPLALLVVGLAIGSGIGVRTRNLDWLGRNLAAEAVMWEAAGLRLDKGEIIRRLFDTQYSASGGQGGSVSNSRNATTTLLFDTAADECAGLRNRTGEKLLTELKTSTVVGFRKLPELITDVNILERVIKEVVCVVGS